MSDDQAIASEPTARRFDPRSGEAWLAGKAVLVTGGTGSFGSAFIHRVVERCQPSRLVVFSRDELKQFEMQSDPRLAHAPYLRFFLGDVRDLDRLEMACRGIDVIIHAAAIKQIAAAEYNPFECIRTNVHGAENVVKSAIRSGVRRVIALSTDKAASPVNLYGASKLASDKIFSAARWIVGAKRDPKFGIVRYGNVLGSRGSIIPFYRKLIANGAKSLPITDNRMTRFWITVQEGVDFVMSCLPMIQGGEIFVPKIPSMSVVDIATAIAPSLHTHLVGIRAGEKLHETMVTTDDARSTLELPDRYVICANHYGEQRGYHTLERPVDEGFHYTSDGNREWLDVAAMRALLSKIDSRSE